MKRKKNKRTISLTYLSYFLLLCKQVESHVEAMGTCREISYVDVVCFCLASIHSYVRVCRSSFLSLLYPLVLFAPPLHAFGEGEWLMWRGLM